jgi:predicted dehydrogenase
MIHDIDIILSFVRGEVAEVRAVGLPILSTKVDIASVRLQFANGCIANLTASRVSTERVRKVRFFQPNQYVSIDYARQDVLVFTVNKIAGHAPTEGGLPQMPDVMPSKPPVIPEEPLRAEILSFLHAVSTRETPGIAGRWAPRSCRRFANSRSHRRTRRARAPRFTDSLALLYSSRSVFIGSTCIAR